jgi:hypothetical protein
MAKEKLAPPKPPRLPSREQVKEATDQQVEELDTEETDEGSVIDQIRSHLAEIEDLLAQVESEVEQG